MPPERKTREKRASFTRKPSDLAKSFDIVLSPWGGLITSQDPYTIPDDRSVWLAGFPELTGSLLSIRKPTTVYSHSSEIKFYFNAYLDQLYHFILDGSSLIALNQGFGVVESISCPLTDVDYTTQGNSAVWVVAENFLVTFDGNQFYDLASYNVFGDSITYWKGRIFIGNGRTLVFSVPDPDYTGTSDPFNISGGAGFIVINIGNFSKILGMVPKEDSVYVFTDNNVIALLGTTISNDPQQWYLTEILQGYGLSGVRQWTRYEHTIYFHTKTGLYSLIATSPDKIDDAIYNMTQSVDYVQWFNYNGIVYVVTAAPSFEKRSEKVLYCWSTLLNRWFVYPDYMTSVCSFRDQSFGAKGNTLLRLFALDSYYPVTIVTKKFFDASNRYYNIRSIYVYGRGASRFTCKLIDDSGISHNYELMNPPTEVHFLWGQGNRRFLFETNDGLTWVNGMGMSFFFLAIYKPPNVLYGKRFKEFQIRIQSEEGRQASLVTLRIVGSVGARYV